MAAFEKRILRRIFGALHNDEIYERYHGRQVVDKIRFNRLRWAGHLIRMQEVNPVRKSIRAISMVEKEDEGDPA